KIPHCVRNDNTALFTPSLRVFGAVAPGLLGAVERAVDVAVEVVGILVPGRIELAAADADGHRHRMFRRLPAPGGKRLAEPLRALRRLRARSPDHHCEFLA